MRYVKYDETIPAENRNFGDISHLIVLQLKKDISEEDFSLSVNS